MARDSDARERLARALDRGFFTTVDLFAGCGGMSLGFHRAGFQCVAAVELDEDARKTHELNFGRFMPEGGYSIHSDITNTSPSTVARRLSPLFPEEMGTVDVVIGGPPCQAFSRLGRAALWRLAGAKDAHGDDDRATMYEHFLRYVSRLRPLAFVMENVREIGKHVGTNIAEEIALTAEEMGYEVRYTLLNAVWFGVPQLRERCFIIGINRNLDLEPRFPVVRHSYKLPVGYSTSRAGKGHIEFLPPHDHYTDHFVRAKQLRQAVSARDAFADLPAIRYHLDGRRGKGMPRDPDTPTSYAKLPNSDFLKAMRYWPDFENSDESFTGHVIRYTPRDYEIFRRMPHGGMYPDALIVAEELFAERLAAAERATGSPVRKGSKLWSEIRRDTIPPYKPNRYPNKFRKMWPEHPARTVPAHIGKDSYSHIHFDSDQARGVSLREAARLQSFPDAFLFSGSMNSRLRQIGNAVPPLLAYAVATSLAKQLSSVFKRSAKKKTMKRTVATG
jgi:DNA (cytosine-5)-methyltransferase 1